MYYRYISCKFSSFVWKEFDFICCVSMMCVQVHCLGKVTIGKIDGNLMGLPGCSFAGRTQAHSHRF